MKIRIVILTVTCLSCLVPEMWSAPLPDAVSIGAAVGAFKGALDGAAKASARGPFAKGFDSIIKFIGSKLFRALAANSDFFKGVALKTAVQGSTLGAGIAIGAAVAASKSHILKHNTLIEHHEEPASLDSFPSYHSDHQFESAPVDSAVFHQKAHGSYGELKAFHGDTHSGFLHLQEHSDGIYR